MGRMKCIWNPLQSGSWQKAMILGAASIAKQETETCNAVAKLIFGESHGATGSHKSRRSERIRGEGNWRHGMVCCYAGAHRTIRHRHLRPAMDSSRPRTGAQRIAVPDDDRSRVSYAFFDELFCVPGDSNPKRRAAGGELWVEARALSGGGTSRLEDSRASCPARSERAARLAGGDLRGNSGRRAGDEALLHCGVDRSLLLLISRDLPAAR